MSLVSALSKLLVKMGGTPATGDNSDELVDKIANAYNPSSGSGTMMVNIVHAPTDDPEGTGIRTLDKTFEEIMSAINNDRFIWVKDSSAPGYFAYGYVSDAIFTPPGEEEIRITGDYIYGVYVKREGYDYPVNSDDVPTPGGT